MSKIGSLLLSQSTQEVLALKYIPKRDSIEFGDFCAWKYRRKEWEKRFLHSGDMNDKNIHRKIKDKIKRYRLVGQHQRQ